MQNIIKSIAKYTNSAFVIVYISNLIGDIIRFISNEVHRIWEYLCGKIPRFISWQDFEIRSICRNTIFALY